jgi:hypothetical protein
MDPLFREHPIQSFSWYALILPWRSHLSSSDFLASSSLLVLYLLLIFILNCFNLSLRVRNFLNVDIPPLLSPNGDYSRLSDRQSQQPKIGDMELASKLRRNAR